MCAIEFCRRFLSHTRVAWRRHCSCCPCQTGKMYRGCCRTGQASVSLHLSPSQLHGSCIFQHSLSDASGSSLFEAWGWGEGYLPSEAQLHCSYVDQRRLLESYGKCFPPPLSYLPKVPALTPQFQAPVPWMMWQHVASPRHILFFYSNTLSIGALIDEMDPSDVQLLLF